MKSRLPIIDFEPFINQSDLESVSIAIGDACREYGFFYLKGHGIDLGMQDELVRASEHFFELPTEEKMKISMAKGGRAWRGYFQVGDELTSGKPDQKEGLYFGEELNSEHSYVQNRTPMHGANLFPENVEMKQIVLNYMKAMTALGHQLMKALSMSLGLDSNYIQHHFTEDPLTLFRIFHYPSSISAREESKESEVNWGVGEHTDYGVLTILKQDAIGGLQVRTKGEWIDAPPIENTFICNIGDMLDKLTGGLFRSTPHRVLNTSGQSRLSFPFFFDPNWNAKITPIHSGDQATDEKRWDGRDLTGFDGTYGEYILEKVARVFPDLVK